MAVVDTVSDWVQVALNAGAIVVGGAVWKLYFDNLKATITTKEAEISLSNERVEYWREKAIELEKRSPEAVEKVLAERIAIREAEITRLAEDRANRSQELSQVEQEVELLNRTLDQTKGFREILAMEQPDPDDPDYQEFVDYLNSREDRVVDVEVVYMGAVGVDSGQLLLTDPCYIEAEWLDEPFAHGRVYRDVVTGRTITWNDDFVKYTETLAGYDQTPEELIASGQIVQLPSPPTPDKFSYSYNGACQATLSTGYGELVYENGHTGAGVAFQSGWGDGFYDVYAEKHDGRIVRVFVNLGADPPLLAGPGRTGRDTAEQLGDPAALRPLPDVGGSTATE